MLSIDCFYKHPQMGDGHLNKCKECTKQDTKDAYRKSITRIKEYDKERNKDPKRKARKAAYLVSYRNKYPSKRLAHSRLSRAIRAGKLERLVCFICGDTNTHAHHEDYNKPLEVIWLCPQHHKDWHNGKLESITF